MYCRFCCFVVPIPSCRSCCFLCSLLYSPFVAILYSSCCIFVIPRAVAKVISSTCLWSAGRLVHAASKWEEVECCVPVGSECNSYLLREGKWKVSRFVHLLSSSFNPAPAVLAALHCFNWPVVSRLFTRQVLLVWRQSPITAVLRFTGFFLLVWMPRCWEESSRSTGCAGKQLYSFVRVKKSIWS